MSGYEPIDLADVSNAGLDAIDTERMPSVGELTFHGLPFRVGGRPRAHCSSCRRLERIPFECPSVGPRTA